MKDTGLAEFMRLYRTAAPDFVPDRRATFDGDEAAARANKLKEIVSRLPETDRAIFIVYLQVGSADKLGRLIGLTKQTAWRAVRAIKNKIIMAYDTNDD